MTNAKRAALTALIAALLAAASASPAHAGSQWTRLFG